MSEGYDGDGKAEVTNVTADSRREFVAYWRARYQYGPKHAFLDEFGNFCTPEDDPIHMGWQAWQAAISFKRDAIAKQIETDVEIGASIGSAIQGAIAAIIRSIN